MPEIQASSGYPGRAAPGSPEGEEEPEVGSEPDEDKGSKEVNMGISPSGWWTQADNLIARSSILRVPTPQ